ncbi:hypothetical protein BLX87_16660 [Bacillus sp. VT-16-64]|nr:hypothetical protein BLX87_16660 [Bacillus sp. VT-16-64]
MDWTKIAQPFGPQTCRMLPANGSDMPDVQSTGFGIYVEDDIELFNGRLTLTPGGRFDWYEHNPQMTAAYQQGGNYNGSLPASNSDSRFTPKLRATYHATMTASKKSRSRISVTSCIPGRNIAGNVPVSKSQHVEPAGVQRAQRCTCKKR